MARGVSKLTTKAVAAIKESGIYSDGGGLYLKVNVGADGVRRRWVFIYRFNAKRREMGLGGYPDTGLAKARETADEARRLVKSGVDPLSARKAVAPVAVPTFGDFADTLIDDIEGGFRNAKHVAQWKMTLGDAYCEAIRSKTIDAVTTDDVLSILRPIWTTKAETASRIRGRIERVLDAAKAKGHRSGENPARWRGHLDALLPKRRKLARGHHAAMPYADVPSFAERLRASDAMAARALEFTILTAARSGEALGATWSEIDLEGALWTVPAERMKAGKIHRVPLVRRALDIVRDLQCDRDPGNPYVFAGQREKRPLSSHAMEMLTRRMKEEATIHGFRSAFRDWCGEETDFAREIAEAALAHQIGNAVERAYRRGDALEKRRALMLAWSEYVG